MCSSNNVPMFSDKESGVVKMDNSNLFTQDEGEDFTKEGGGYQIGVAVSCTNVHEL